MIDSVSIKTGALADPKASELDQLKAAAKQFEAIFTRQMMKSMRDAKLSDDDLFGSDATDTFREMQHSQLADELANKGAIGIADLLVKQFEARVSKTVQGSDSAAAPTAGKSDGGAK